MGVVEPVDLVALISSLPEETKENILGLGFFIQEFQHHKGIVLLSLVENPESHYGAKASFKCSECSGYMVGEYHEYWLAEDFDVELDAICHDCAMQHFSLGSFVGLSDIAVMRLLIEMKM